jgi:hypothetical protein
METKTQSQSQKSSFKPVPNLRMIPGHRRNDPLFTREQKVFLSESLILIGSAIALVLLFLHPGSSRAATAFDHPRMDRTEELQRERLDKIKNRKNAIEVAGNLRCAGSNTNENCADLMIEEFGTGKTYMLQNAEMASNLLDDGITRVRITGNTANAAGRNVAQNTTSLGVIQVTRIEKMD